MEAIGLLMILAEYIAERDLLARSQLPREVEVMRMRAS